MKTKKVLNIRVVSNIFPTILHTSFYPRPSLLTTLPPIYILPITPRFHPFPTLHFTTLPFTSLHFTSLHYTSRWFSLHFTSLHFQMIFTSLHYTSRWFSLHFTSLPFTTLFNDFPHTFFQITSISAFLALFFKVFNLQGRVRNTSAGSWFQSWIVLFTKEYFPISVLCLRLLIFRSWSILLR